MTCRKVGGKLYKLLLHHLLLLLMHNLIRYVKTLALPLVPAFGSILVVTTGIIVHHVYEWTGLHLTRN